MLCLWAYVSPRYAPPSLGGPYPPIFLTRSQDSHRARLGGRTQGPDPSIVAGRVTSLLWASVPESTFRTMGSSGEERTPKLPCLQLVESRWFVLYVWDVWEYMAAMGRKLLGWACWRWPSPSSPRTVRRLPSPRHPYLVGMGTGLEGRRGCRGTQTGLRHQTDLPGNPQISGFSGPSSTALRRGAPSYLVRPHWHGESAST